MKELIIGHRKVLIDDDDRNLISQYKWCIRRVKRTRSDDVFYVFANHHKPVVQMHRLIMGFPNGKSIDHINGNGLDNRKSNLRFCTPSQNQANRKVIYSSMGYKGVSFYKKDRIIASSIKVDGKSIYLGSFETTELAAKGLR